MDVAALIMQTAIANGIDPYLALAVAQQESGLNPNAVGDGGYSFGLYQENTAGGAGSTHLNNGGSYDDFFDPVSSTQRFADRIKYAMSQLGPDASPGEIAYAAQRPANRDAYIGAIDSIYQNESANAAAAGGPKVMFGLPPEGGTGDMANPTDNPMNVSDPGAPYDPSLFGDTTDQGGEVPVDTGGEGGGGLDLGAAWNNLTNWWQQHFGGGSSTPSDQAPPAAGHGIPQVHSMGNGRFLFTYADGFTEVRDFGAGTKGNAYAGTPLEQAAAKAGFYKYDENEGYTPDVAAYVQFMNAKNAKAIAPPTGRAGSGIVNLGNGRYLVKNPDGTYTEKTFGGAAGATPPSLDPTRASIVNYLRALLGQNDLPYAGVTPAQTAGAAAPSTTAPTVPPTPLPPGTAPAVVPPGPPTIGPTTVLPGVGLSSTIPAGGGIVGQPGSNGLVIGGTGQPNPTPPTPAPTIGTGIPGTLETATRGGESYPEPVWPGGGMPSYPFQPLPSNILPPGAAPVSSGPGGILGRQETPMLPPPPKPAPPDPNAFAPFDRSSAGVGAST